MSIVLLTILASALQGAIAFQTTSTGCVTCGPPPDSSASSCVAVFGDLVIGAGGPNSNIETAEGNGFCCAQSSTSCASFASDTGLENIAEDCDAACANIFASNSSSTGGSTAASPGGSASTVGTQAAPAAAPAISVVSTSPTPAGSTTGYSNPFYDSFCSQYFTIQNDTDIDTTNTVLSPLASAGKSQIAGPTQCCGWCLANQACVAWVYNTITTPTNCFLKSGSSLEFPTESSPNCVQSGYLQEVSKKKPTSPAYALNAITT